MKVIVLAGGLGTRLREETEYRPKPMVEIGGRPIVWSHPAFANRRVYARNDKEIVCVSLAKERN